jgi:hypothetical protein
LGDVQDADEDGVHDADEWSGESDTWIGKLSGYVGTVSR